MAATLDLEGQSHPRSSIGRRLGEAVPIDAVAQPSKQCLDPRLLLSRTNESVLPYLISLRKKTEMTRARDLIELCEDVLFNHKVLDEIIVFDPATDTAHRLDEGKWIPTNTSNTMRIDQPTHGVGQTHAHIYGRKGNKVGAVNVDGSASHGTKIRLDKKDAEMLRAHGFNIRPDRIVEWIVRPDWTPALLFG